MSKEKQIIEEMAKAMCGNGMSNGNCAMEDEPCNLECVYGCCAERLYNEGYRKQSEGEWKWEHDALNDPKRYFVRTVCSCCGLKTGQVSNFCPNCGAKMKGGAE